MFIQGTYLTYISSVQYQWKKISVFGINTLVLSWLQSFLAKENNNLQPQVLVVFSI